MKRQFTKVPILSNTFAINHPAGDAVELVKEHLEDLGFYKVNAVSKRPARNSIFSEGHVSLTYRFHPYGEEGMQKHIDSLMRTYPNEYPTYESAFQFLEPSRDYKDKTYHNFELLQELYGEAGDEDSHDPLRHKGGGYSKLDESLIDDVKQLLLDAGYSNVTVIRQGFGMHGIDETLVILIRIPIKSADSSTPISQLVLTLPKDIYDALNLFSYWIGIERCGNASDFESAEAYVRSRTIDNSRSNIKSSLASQKLHAIFEYCQEQDISLDRLQKLCRKIRNG